MKLICATVLSLLLFVGHLSAFASDGKHLYDAYKANEKKMESSMKSMVMVQAMEGQGMVAEVTIYKKGEKMRMESVIKKSVNPVLGKPGEKSIMINDGKTTWSFSPMMGKVTSPNDEAEEDMRKPQQIRDLGPEIISGIACRKLSVVYPYEEMEILWISEKNSVLVKEESGDDQEKTTIVYSDFKTIKGMPFAHLIQTYENGQLIDTLRVNSLEFNTRLDDALFNPDLVKGYPGKSAGASRKGGDMGGGQAMEMMQMSMEIQRLYQNGEVEKAKALEKKMQKMMQ